MSLMQSLVLCSAPGLAGVTYTKALLHKVNLSAETLFPMQLSVVFKVPKHLLGVFSKKKKKKSKFSHLLLKFLLKSHNLSVKCYIILAIALYLLLAEAIFNTLPLCL